MAPMTDHELRQEAEERERMWTKRVREIRQGAMRDCPAGRALDRDHVVALIGQQWSSSKPYLHARRFVVAGMQSYGYAVPVIAQAVGLTNAEVANMTTAPLWWDPPASMLADLPEEHRGRVIGPR
jgi:hypothetical protein